MLKAEVESGLANEGDVLLAEYQSEGRGRMDREWISPPGKSLLFSIALFPELTQELTQLVGILISLAVREGISNYLKTLPTELRRDDYEFTLKWPNDILANHKKVCGILCETGIDKRQKAFVIAGVGLNVNQSSDDFPDNLRYPASSLSMIFGLKHRREVLLRQSLRSIEYFYLRMNSEGTDWISKEWLKMSGLSGKKVTLRDKENTYTGVCTGMGLNGALILRMQNGTQRDFYSGDTA